MFHCLLPYLYSFQFQRDFKQLIILHQKKINRKKPLFFLQTRTVEGQGFSPSKGFGLYKYFSYHGVFYPRLLGFRKKNSCIPLGYLIYIRHNLSPGGRHGNPLQYSCLEKPPIGRGAWQVVCHGVTDIQTQLSDSAQHSSNKSEERS